MALDIHTPVRITGLLEFRIPSTLVDLSAQIMQYLSGLEGIIIRICGIVNTTQDGIVVGLWHRIHIHIGPVSSPMSIVSGTNGHPSKQPQIPFSQVLPVDI